MLAEIRWDAGTLSIALIFGMPIIAILGSYWYKVAKVTSDNELKRSMIERGMSVEEIERVLAARSFDRKG